MFLPAELIKKKRAGEPHTPEEIQFLIQSYTCGETPDYQIAAWLMAIFFKGMSFDETVTLTKAMRDSGRVLDFSDLGTPVDKHSTGGVGDKTTLILAPIVAAAGVPVPMIAGRGLGHTGGTIDKLESIHGFSAHVSLDKFEKLVREFGLSIIGQTMDICPADRKIYALRDVTGTIESRPLICASIMSKKLAEGISALVLDVKFGSGAFMKTLSEAMDLARALKKIGEGAGIEVSALLTDMNEPMGRFVGNALEVHECLEILRGVTYVEDGVDFYEDTRELSLDLAGHMIWIGRKAKSFEEGRRLAEELLSSGKALKVFEDLCLHQGARDLKLPIANKQVIVASERAGVVQGFATEAIGISSIMIGAGRKSSHDKIDPTAGFEILVKRGMSVEKGQPLFKMYADSDKNFDVVSRKLVSSVTISSEPLKWPGKLVEHTLPFTEKEL